MVRFDSNAEISSQLAYGDFVFQILQVIGVFYATLNQMPMTKSMSKRNYLGDNQQTNHMDQLALIATDTVKDAQI